MHRSTTLADDRHCDNVFPTACASELIVCGKRCNIIKRVNRFVRERRTAWQRASTASVGWSGHSVCILNERGRKMQQQAAPQSHGKNCYTNKIIC